MRISDWSSDVCSSDLLDRGRGVFKCLLGLVQRFAQTFGGVLHGGLDRIGGFLHLALQVVQLVQIHLALDVGFDVTDVTLGAPDQVPYGTGYFGQALWPDDDQRTERSEKHKTELQSLTRN